MKILDSPPFWLAGFLIVAWALSRFFPQTVVSLPYLGVLSLILVLAGVVLTVLATVQMGRAKTTMIPRQDPDALVTAGIFRRTRNPIYVADLLFLGAGIVWWGSLSAILLLWIFPMVINRRFIDGEEEKLRAFFGKEFDDWSEKTKRWW